MALQSKASNGEYYYIVFFQDRNDIVVKTHKFQAKNITIAKKIAARYKKINSGTWMGSKPFKTIVKRYAYRV